MSEAKKVLHLFRHGETDWNSAGRLQGGTDVPLNSKGRQQAYQLTEYFSNLPAPLEIILSSDLDRARETAKIAAGSLSIPIHVDHRIRETNLGQAEGLTESEILSSLGPEVLRQWRIFPDLPGSRFPGGESKQEHLDRLLQGLTDFVEGTPYSQVGVSTHGGSIRRLMHHWLKDLPSPISVPNCSLFRVTYDPSQKLWSPDPLALPVRK